MPDFRVENPLSASAYAASVSNSDGTLTISPTTGNVIASIALNHANTWSGQQTFVAPILGTPASGVATNLTGTASGLTAGNVTTNANLTGPVTSVGNATSFAAGTLLGHQIWGLGLTWSSSSAVLVGFPTGTAGQCPDSTFASLINLAAQATVTITSNGAISGNDSFQGTGTAATNNGNATITGTSTLFFTEFKTRALTVGTVSSSGGTLTGTSTKFLAEVKVGDLIGNTTKGYFQVTAIASNTSLTLVSTPGSAFSSSTVNVIENPTIKVGANTAVQVTAIASDTSLTICANSSGTLATTTYRIGVPPTTTTMPATGNNFMYIWAASGGSGTGCYASTQRTTAFGVTGYTTSIRRLWSILLNAGSIQEFSQAGTGDSRFTRFEFITQGNSSRIQSAGSATGWTATTTNPGSACISPTSYDSVLQLFILGSAGKFGYVRGRNIGNSNNTRNEHVVCNDATNGTTMDVCVPCDQVQLFDYVVSDAAASLYIDVVGYHEAT